MSRQMRIEYPGAVYHVTSRGNEKNDIFYEDADKNCFLENLADVTKRYNWICHSYCLMTNHYHLLIETPDGNLSYGMRQLNGVYCQRFNAIHARVGHLFQGRYKSIIVDRENYLLELCRYIVLNPVRAKITKRPEDYFWSSYRATIALQKCPEFLTIDCILKQFGDQRSIARKKYIEFVYAGVGGASPWDNLRGKILLGKETFIQTLETLINKKADIPDISRTQRNVLQELAPDIPTLDAKIPSSASRNKTVCDMHHKNGMPINKIAKIFSLHPSTISKIVNQR